MRGGSLMYVSKTLTADVKITWAFINKPIKNTLQFSFLTTLRLTTLVRIQIRVTINVSKRFHLREVMNFSSGILEACPQCLHSLSHAIAELWRLSI